MTIWKQGGINLGFFFETLRPAAGRKFLVVLAFKIAWTTLRKCSTKMIFAKTIAFSKRIISKFSRLRRATLPTMSNLYSARAPPTQAIFQNLQLSRSIHSHAQNVFINNYCGWRAGTWLYRIYGRLRRSLHNHAQNAFYMWPVRGRNFITFDPRAATTLSTCTNRL